MWSQGQSVSQKYFLLDWSCQKVMVFLIQSYYKNTRYENFFPKVKKFLKEVSNNGLPGNTCRNLLNIPSIYGHTHYTAQMSSSVRLNIESEPKYEKKTNWW